MMPTRDTCRQEDNIKTDLKQRVDWIHLAQNTNYSSLYTLPDVALCSRNKKAS